MGVSLELVGVQPMQRGIGTNYPYITDGRGQGIIDDIFPSELLDIIKHTDKTGELHKVFDTLLGNERNWDYRDFNLKYCNALLKGHVLNIQQAYEYQE